MPGRRMPTPTGSRPIAMSIRPQLPASVGAQLHAARCAAGTAARRARRYGARVMATNGMARKLRAQTAAVVDAMTGRRRRQVWTWLGAAIAAGVVLGAVAGTRLRAMTAHRPTLPEYDLEFVDVDQIDASGQRAEANRPW